MKEIVIFGLNDFADLAHYYLVNDPHGVRRAEPGAYIAAFTANKKFIKQGTKLGKPVVAFEELEKTHPPNRSYLFVPMSGSKINTDRERIYKEGLSRGYTFISYVSNRATVLTENIGENCFILEDNTIQPFTEIGNNVVMWSGNHIGHSSIIKDNVFISSHVVISGHCTLENNSWLGVNSSVRDRVKIAERSLISMGASVITDTVNDGVYMGVPAKRLDHKLSSEVAL